VSGLVIDNFAGGGGASTGIEAALGRPVDVAINHDEAAIAVHAANHPDTRHFCQSIYAVDPMEATGGAPVALVWFSPDCKHFSKAKGGKPREKRIRDLAHVVPHWIERLKKATPGGRGAPKVIMLENVEEFRQWGPLDDAGKPIKERCGEEFDLWVRRIRRQGYKVEWRELRACDYGAPTSRKRLFLIARRDGLPIVWPEPTHGKPGSPDVVSGKLKPWRSAAECIDWSRPCPSIFDRKRDLKDATCRRIAAGVMRYVVNAARPFIVPVTHTQGGNTSRSVDDPLATVTTAKGGEFAAVMPFVAPLTHHGSADRGTDVRDVLPTVTAAHRGEQALVAGSLAKLRRNSVAEDVHAPLGAVTSGGLHHAAVAASLIQMGYGEREGQEPRVLDVERPLGTVVGGGNKFGKVAAFLSHYYTSNTNGGRGSPELPHKTICTGGQGRIVAAHLAQHNTQRGSRANPGQLADRPMSTITGRGTQQQVVQTTLVEADALPPDMMASAVRVAAFLVKYYGNEVDAHGVDAPLGTVTTRERFAVVTVTIKASTFVLVDIGMRMLEPRELANAQGFPRDYILDPECWYATDSGGRNYGRLPKSQQIAKIGNAVCPPIAEALVRANVGMTTCARAVAA
jgi:DNA (cytosine-5)-methyltransferase 1